jgi:hypothetical protein
MLTPSGVILTLSGVILSLSKDVERKRRGDNGT